MYIRTPKRYRRMQRRRVFSCQRFLLVLILIVLIVIGVGIYEIRDTVQPDVIAVVDNGMQQAETWRATQFAPTPQPTRDPSGVLIDADNDWTAGRIEFALNSYDEVLNLVPNDPTIYTRIAEGYLTRGNIDDAFDYADDTVTADPFNADAWATRSLVYSWEGDTTEGIASAQQALALNPENVRATAYLGYAYFQVSDAQASLALSIAEDAIALDPDHWAGYWVRGLVYENVFPVDLVQAAVDYERAYNLAQTQNPAMAGVAGAGLGRVVSTQGDANRAVQLLNEMLNADSSNRELLYWLGWIHYNRLGEYTQAQDPFSNCVEVAPTDETCWYMLGRTRNTLGNQEAAIAAFEEAVQLDTQFARHYYWRAAVAVDTGSCNEATEYLEIGYDMAIEGGLSALDEGNAELISAFEFQLDRCRIVILPDVPQVTAEPEITPESTVDVGDA